MKIQHDIAYGQHARQKLDVYAPARNPTKTIIIFWHGGSWQRGNKSTYRLVGRALARLGYTAVVPNYRLYPEVSWPVFAEDAARVAAWAAHELRGARIIAMGHSAGGQIAAAVSFDRHYLDRAGASAAIKGFIGLAGGYSFTPAASLQPVLETGRTWKPVDLVALDPVPCLLIHGRLDSVVSPSNSKRLAEVVRGHGGRATELYFPHLDHMTLLMPFVVGWWSAPSMRQAIAEFVESV